MYLDLLLALLVSVPTVAQSAPPTPPATAPAAPLNSNFRGKWVGQLEYRDFQSNEQTFLPTWLTMTPLPDGHSVTLEYVYDDGPAKVVRESSTLALASGTATLTSNRDHTNETFTLAGLEEFAKLDRGILTLTGTSRENNKPVDTRITLTLRRNLYTFRKETRAAGTTEPFRFRDAYTFTRAEVPVEVKVEATPHP